MAHIFVNVGQAAILFKKQAVVTDNSSMMDLELL